MHQTPMSLRRWLLCAMLLLPALMRAQAYNYPDGSVVADFTVTDVDGQPHALYDYTATGKYVLLDFFTLWCAPCQETAPYWAELYQTYGCNSGDVICLSLNYDNNTADEIHAYSDTYCGPWAHPPVVNNALALSDVFGVGNAPNYCLIGPNNVMIDNFIWTVDSMADFLAAFPDGSGIAPQACGVGVPERVRGQLAAWPNPTTGLVRITLNTDERVWQVVDALGRKLPVHMHRTGATDASVDLLPYPPGIYTLHTTDARGNARSVRVLRCD